MRITTSTLIITLLLSILSIIPLLCVSKQDNDLLFIISLYENGQYELAMQQISLFEAEYAFWPDLNTITFIKANIEYQLKNYDIADSLYSVLLNRQTDNSMLTEILINKADIKYIGKDWVTALTLVEKAQKTVMDSSSKYRIAILKGKIYSDLLNPISARNSFQIALNLRKDDPIALLWLLKSYISLNEEAEADGIIERLITSKSSLQDYTEIINTWLDYSIGMENYNQIENFIRTTSFTGTKLAESTLLRLAKEKYLTRNYNEAEKMISECSSYQGYCLYLQALIYKEQGQIILADSIFTQISKGFYKQENIESDYGENIIINSWLERIKILYDEDPDAALNSMQAYLAYQTKAEQDPYVLYVYSSLLFKSKMYQDAIKHLLLVKYKAVSPELDHNVQIMLGDIWFNAKVTDSAEQAYKEYLVKYPNGRYKSHAIYNLALIYYDRKSYKEASEQLDRLLRITSDQELIEKSQYLLAEIDFYQANYRKALEQYIRIIPHYLKQVNIDFRLAQCYYYMEDFYAAAEYIPKLTIDSDNAFQIMMLEGNIYFNLTQYEQALGVYQEALPYAKTEMDIREVNSYIALTLYRLERFTEATALYLNLSQDKESPQSYLIMAAKASYHAKQYQQALLLFKQFVDENPGSIYYNFALANIGSIYYNQGDFKQATQTWMGLLKRYEINQYFDEDDQVILASVFTGLQWCLKQNPDQKVLDEINELIDRFSSDYVRFELQYLLLKVYFGSELWSDILKLADNMRAEFPQKENNEIRRYVAASLSGLDRTTEADSVYQQIFTLEPTPEILTEWADMEIKAGNYNQAMNKLNRALGMDVNPVRFLKLLKTSYVYQPDSLGYYWDTWSPEMDSIPDQANFILMEWQFDRQNWTKADSLAQDLLLNPDYQIRSHAQLVVAVSLYSLGKYNDAVTELYRTVYIYPDDPELILEAKKYLVRAYAQLKDAAQARKVFNEISSELTPPDKDELDRISSEGGE